MRVRSLPVEMTEQLVCNVVSFSHLQIDSFLLRISHVSEGFGMQYRFRKAMSIAMIHGLHDRK